MATHHPDTYRFSTVGYITLYCTLLTAYFMCVSIVQDSRVAPDRLRHVDLTPPCRKRVASKCNFKALTSRAGRSLNFHGEPFIIRPIFRPSMGMSAPSAVCYAIPDLKYSNRLLTSGWWAWARKPVSRSLSSSGATEHVFRIELQCRLGTELNMGSSSWHSLPHPLFLFRILPGRVDASRGS